MKFKVGDRIVPKIIGESRCLIKPGHIYVIAEVQGRWIKLEDHAGCRCRHADRIAMCDGWYVAKEYEQYNGTTWQLCPRPQAREYEYEELERFELLMLEE